MISAALAILETQEQRNELSEIYEHHKKTFYAIAYSKLQNRPDAEDAIQEAFLAVAKNPAVFFAIPNNKRVPYINVMIRNISCKIWNKKHNILEDEAGLDQVMDEQISVEDIVISEYTCKQVLAFIDTLSEASKTALYCKMSLGLKYGDIATLLGVSEAAVRKRITRALRQIKEYVEGLNNE